MLLDRQMKKIQELVKQMGEVSQNMMSLTYDLLQNRDVELADKIILADAAVDELETEIEEECLHALALYQPVAFDLRYLVIVLKLNRDLERIGDQCTNIARAIQKMVYDGHLIEYPFDLVDMHQKTKNMFDLSLEALDSLNVDLAKKVRSMDDEVDEIDRLAVSATLTKIQEQPDSAGAYLPCIEMAHIYERIADKAVNIAKDVEVLVEGDWSSFHSSSIKRRKEV